MQVTLTKVYLDDEKIGKTGKPYRFLKIQTQEHGDTWISGFQDETTKNWKSGDTVEVDVTQNGKYLNYKPAGARKPSKTWDKLNELEKRIVELERGKNLTTDEFDNLVETQDVPDDLPF